MRLLDRYLVRELLVPLGACLACFLIFWVGFDTLSRLEDFQREKLRLPDVLLFYWYSMPELLLTVLPVGLLLALLYALTHHARHHELTAIRSAGVSIWRMVTPYLVLGFGFSILLHALNDVWLSDAPERAQKVRRRYLAGTNDTGWIERVNFHNQAAQRFWNIGAFHPVLGEMRVPSFREPLPNDAFRVVKASGMRWVNGGWRLDGTQEFIHRSAADESPGTKGEVYVPMPETTLRPADIAAWPAPETVISNVLWRTNLQHEASGGQRWIIGAYCPTNGEMRDVSLRIPLGLGAQRAVVAGAAVWTNGGWRFFRAQELIYRSANDPNPLPVPFAGPTNQLDLPELNEAPALIRSELKISSLNLGRAMRRPQLSIREILDYQKLHPAIRPDLAALLDTQLHARLAAPWTCLVVVLIAVPFGTPSGRRNIFYGVAGSIAIAFGYFVLQRIGYAVAQNGQIPAWAGAWLPNVVFAVTGVVLITRIR